MFIRFKHSPRSGGCSSLSVYVAESRREDSKPRQKVVRYLGTIKESSLPFAQFRLKFWQRAVAAIEGLNLPAEVVQQLTEAIAARVPYLTPEEHRSVMARQEEAARREGKPLPAYEPDLPFVRPV
ncbi:MAG TPA: hypothetical protein VFA07_07845 [Chthonomonadaceae bacterium]|nr:hypothetical protein [Chthonomonadaceae bacterium]